MSRLTIPLIRTRELKKQLYLLKWIQIMKSRNTINLLIKKENYENN